MINLLLRMQDRYVPFRLFARRDYTLRSQWRSANSHFLQARNCALISFNEVRARHGVSRARRNRQRSARLHRAREPLTQRRERGENRKCSVKVRRCLHSARICIRTGLRFFAIALIPRNIETATRSVAVDATSLKVKVSATHGKSPKS